MEDHWDENEWQGKRKDQVEFSGKALLFGMVGLIVIVVIMKLFLK